LVEVGCSVFDDLDRHDLLGLEVLTLDHLPKRSLTEDIEDQVSVSARNLLAHDQVAAVLSGWCSVLVPGLLGAQYVIHVEDVVAILIVISVVLDALAWLG